MVAALYNLRRAADMNPSIALILLDLSATFGTVEHLNPPSGRDQAGGLCLAMAILLSRRTSSVSEAG